MDDDVERAVGGHGPVVAVLGLAAPFGSVCVEGCSPCRERVGLPRRVAGGKTANPLKSTLRPRIA